MAVTLSKIAERVWRELGHLVDMTATGGSTTTIVVNSSENTFTSDDQLIGGTAIVTRDSGGAGAAPEGEFAIISDYVSGTYTWTIGALTAAVASGDHVGLVQPKIKLTQMKNAINDGLANLGTISLVDTSLTTAAAQTEYALPVGLKIKKLLDVQLQGNINDANDNQYYSIMGMIDVIPAAPGSTGLLVFNSQPIASRTIKIIYEGVHPELNAYSDTVSETIQEELAVAAAIEKAAAWYVSKRGQSALGTFDIQRWQDVKQNLQLQLFNKPVNRTMKRPRYFLWSGGGEETETFTVPSS